MEEEIKAIAEREGWSDATLIAVLIDVLEGIARGLVDPSTAGICDAIEERAHG